MISSLTRLIVSICRWRSCRIIKTDHQNPEDRSASGKTGHCRFTPARPTGYLTDDGVVPLKICFSHLESPDDWHVKGVKPARVYSV